MISLTLFLALASPVAPPGLATVSSGAAPTVHQETAENQAEESIAFASAEWLWDLERIGEPVVSPAGRWVVAPLTRHDREDGKAHTDLWLFDLEGGEPRPLTRHGAADGQAVFRPDGSALAFVSKREGDDAPQLYLLPMDEPGEARRLTELATGVSAPKWGGEHLYFLSRLWRDKDLEEQAAAVEADKKSKVSARVWNDLPTRHWDHFLDEARDMHILRVPAAGGEIEPITPITGWALSRGGAGAGSYDVSPDGSLIVFQADSRRDPIQPDPDLFLLAPGRTVAHNLTVDNNAWDGNPRFSPDGRTLAYTRQRTRGFYGDNNELVLLDLSTSEKRFPHRGWDRSADGLVWLPDGAGLIGSIDDAGTRRLYLLGGEGEPVAWTAATSFSSPAPVPTGGVVALQQSFDLPPRLVFLAGPGAEPRALESRNEAALASVQFGEHRSVTYAGADGAEVQMWIQYPPDFDPERSYPLLLLVHGGPHNAITDGFHLRWNSQIFAAWGYVVAWPNFHGSSGFGRDFTDSINPDWFTKPYADVLAAADWLAQRPYVDPERMVAAGASYGGYLTSAILGHEHPFRTFVIHAPVYNMYSQMAADFAVHSQRFGDYWDDPTIYRSISPHYFAAGFSTPAMIIHGELDYRVPVGQAFELFRTLRHRGLEARLVYYPDENHWILKRHNSIHWYGEVRAWIDRFTSKAQD